MTFEVFQRPPKGRQPGDHPRVRVGPNGSTLTLNQKARILLGKPSKVLLLSDGKSIAFQAAEPGDERAFNLAQGNISCSLFIQRAGLIPGTRLDLFLEDGLLRSGSRG